MYPNLLRKKKQGRQNPQQEKSKKNDPPPGKEHESPYCLKWHALKINPIFREGKHVETNKGVRSHF